MTEATRTIKNSLSVESIRKGVPWTVNDDYQNPYSKAIVTLEQEYREYTEGETDKAVEAVIPEV